jgi:sec-independent protein translocase protein TatA
MDFLGIGLPEIILVLLIAAIVVGPKRLPEVAVQLARLIRQLRGYATDVTSQMRSELDELTREYEQVRKDLQEFRESATKEVRSVINEVDRAAREAPAIIESSAEEKPQKRLPPPREKTAADDGS